MWYSTHTEATTWMECNVAPIPQVNVVVLRVRADKSLEFHLPALSSLVHVQGESPAPRIMFIFRSETAEVEIETFSSKSFTLKESIDDPSRNICLFISIMRSDLHCLR